MSNASPRPLPAVLRSAFQPQILLSSLVAGLITGVLTISITIAMAALIFAGDLAPHMPAGLGMMLFGSMVVSLELGRDGPMYWAGRRAR